MAEELIQEAAEPVIQIVSETNGGSGKWFFYGLVVGANIGAAAGYYATRKRTETKFRKIADDEIAEMKAHYLAKEKSAAEKKPTIDEVMEEQGYKTKLEGPDEVLYVKVEPAEEEAVVSNVFEHSEYGDVWDYAEEEKHRVEDPALHVPYIIHRDEFMANERDYTQQTITYYEGDDTLCDERDGTIDDQDATIGLGNLGKFGHGSGDVNIVYVRNVELEMEYEIVHSDNKYAVEVAGFSDDELKHSARIPRRRRGFDDE